MSGNNQLRVCVATASIHASEPVADVRPLFSKAVPPVTRPAMQVRDRQNKHVMVNSAVDHTVGIPAQSATANLARQRMPSIRITFDQSNARNVSIRKTSPN